MEQADELFSDIIYQDEFVIYSYDIIANAKDITQMAAFDEILWSAARNLRETISKKKYSKSRDGCKKQSLHRINKIRIMRLDAVTIE